MRVPVFLLGVWFALHGSGHAWSQQDSDVVRITPLVSGVVASFRGVAVRDANEAWVTGTGGTVLRTVDAGKTWKRVTVPNAEELDFRDVELLPDSVVLLMSIGEGDSSRVLRSSDDGASWKTVLVNERPAGFFDGFAFDEDGKHGVLVGDPINGRLDLFRTADAGASWSAFPDDQRPRLEEGEYCFAASGTSIVVRGDDLWIATGGSVARVLHSSDDGMTWLGYETLIRSGNESSGIFSIAVADKDRAVIVGGDYRQPELDRMNVAASADGGESWNASPSIRMPHKACVQSLGRGRWLTCGRTGVAFSTDAGQSWTNVTTQSYFTLAFDSDYGTGFLAGADGRVARFELED